MTAKKLIYAYSTAAHMRYLLTFFRWLIALLLCSWGIFMATGFIAEKLDGGSEQPIWFDLFFFALVGLVPLAGGLLLILLPWLRPRPRAAKSNDHPAA